jgi:hypothetical protein
MEDGVVSSRLEDIGELLSMPHSIRDLRERIRERGVPAPVTDELEPKAIGRATA